MFTGKKVLVLGLARSGIAATKLLLSQNAIVTVNEYQSKDQIECYDELISLGVEVIAGGHPDDLFERDFDFVIKNPGIPYHKPFLLRLQERNIPIYTEIELGYLCTKQHQFIAITGTNGKTTTTTLVYQILKSYHPNTYVGGNIGKAYCQVILDEDLMNKKDCIIVLEMSSFQLLNINEFKPHISTIINLSPDHLDYMDSLEEYYQSKTNIYKNQDQNDYFILNQDDPEIKKYVTNVPCKIHSFSLDNQNTNSYLCNDIFYIDGHEILSTKDIQLVGKHNLQNMIVAITICYLMNVPIQHIKEVVTSFKGVEHRIEYVRELNGVKYYNDSKATNIESTIVALQSFTQPIILLIGGFEKGLDINQLEPYLTNVKTIITFGDAGKRFSKDLDRKDTINVARLEDAVSKAHQIALDHDIVLLSPTTSSFDQFKNFEERGVFFKECVHKL